MAWNRETVDKHWDAAHVVADGEPMGFTPYRCWSCNGLAGDRYRVMYQLHEERDTDLWHEEEVCADCIMYLAYGEVPDGCEG